MSRGDILFVPDARLQLVADFVDPGRVVADVGTDHAVLPIALIRSGKISRAIASDVRVGPLNSAITNIAAAGLTGQIETRLSDGLDAYKPGEVDCIVMAGMGGLLITQLLGRAPWIKTRQFQLVLQPMTDAPLLRSFLAEQGFTLLQERCAADARHVYTVMQAEYTGESRSLTPEQRYTGALLNNPGVYEKRYLEKELIRLKKQIGGITVSGGDPSSLLALYKNIRTAMEAEYHDHS